MLARQYSMFDFGGFFTPLFVNTDKMQWYSFETSDNVGTRSYEIGFVLRAPYPLWTLFAPRTQNIVSAFGIAKRRQDMNYPILIFYSQIIVSRMQPRNTFKRVGWGSGEKCRHFFLFLFPLPWESSVGEKKQKKKPWIQTSQTLNRLLIQWSHIQIKFTFSQHMNQSWSLS